MRALLLGLALVLAGCTAPAAPPPQPPPSEPAPEPADDAAPTLDPTDPAPPPPGAPEPEAAPPAPEEETPTAPPTPSPSPASGPSPQPLPPPSPSPSPQPSPQPSPRPPPSSPPVALLPVHFERGADAAPSAVVRRLAISADGGSFEATLAGVDGATVRVDSLVRIVNGDAATRVVRLTSEPVDDARVVAARWRAPGAELDLRNATPMLEVAMGPGATLDLAFELTLAGAAEGDTLFARRVDMSVA